MKKNLLYTSLTFIICFIALTTNVKALTCTYYAKGEDIKHLQFDHSKTSNVTITCELDSGKTGFNICKATGDKIEGSEDNGQVRVYNWETEEPSGVYEHSHETMKHVKGKGYKNYTLEHNKCPSNIFMWRSTSSREAVFGTLEAIKEWHEEGMQNAQSVTVFVGSLKKNDTEAENVQEDINESDAEAGKKPDYVQDDPKDEPENKIERICGIFGSGTFYYIKMAWNIIKYATPILIIIVGILNFVKAVFSGEDKDLKIAGQKFIKQIIIGVAIILLPVLLQFILDLVGFSENCLQHFL